MYLEDFDMNYDISLFLFLPLKNFIFYDLSNIRLYIFFIVVKPIWSINVPLQLKFNVEVCIELSYKLFHAILLIIYQPQIPLLYCCQTPILFVFYQVDPN